MVIKKISDLSKYEGELIITDGIKDLLGTCVSLPLPNDKIVKIGYPVNCLYAFFLNDDPTIEILTNPKKQIYSLRKIGLIGMSYEVQGCVIDSEKYLIKSFGFTISLEYLYGSDYENNKEPKFKDGDWVLFTVDRFDVILY